MTKKLLLIVKKFKAETEELIISFIVSIFALLRLPSVIEPYWYGDEGIYQVLGIALRQGRILYRDIWDNKPPLLYLIYAVFNGEQFYVRLFSIIAGAGAVIFFFYLARNLFKNFASVIVSTSFFAILFALPVIEGNIANAENFMLLPTIAAFYLVVKGLNKSTKNKFLLTFVAGILISLSFLTKTVAIFDLAALFVSIFILRFIEGFHLKRENLHKVIKDITNGLEHETLLGLGFIIPIILTVLYFLFSFALPDFFKATFSQNIGYVGHGNFFLFPMGLLYLKLTLLIFSILLIIRYRNIVEASGVIILTWLSFALFNAFFSQRPYTHYLLVMLPPLALFIGYIVENKKLSKITLPLLLILFFLVMQTFKLNFKRIGPYYANFFSFISNNKDLTSYRAFFDKNTPRDYNLASFIKSKTTPSENVYLWSDSAQIYSLSNKLPPGRYTVSYHATFYPDAVEETRKAIEEKKVKYIIQTKEHPEIQKLLNNYEIKYRIDGATIYERKS